MTSRSDPRVARRRARAVLIPAAALLFATTGCGGGTSNDSSEPTAVATLAAEVRDDVQVFSVVGQLDQTFSARELVARPGKIQVDFSVAKGSAPHNFVVPRIPGAATDILPAGESQSITFTVSEPGRYQVVCTLHRGMTATLVIL